MSNFDLLTKEEALVAFAQGWSVHHVYELETQKWGIRILPSDAAAGVVNLARQGNALALKALRLTVHGNKGKE